MEPVEFPPGTNDLVFEFFFAESPGGNEDFPIGGGTTEKGSGFYVGDPVFVILAVVGDVAMDTEPGDTAKGDGAEDRDCGPDLTVVPAETDVGGVGHRRTQWDSHM